MTPKPAPPPSFAEARPLVFVGPSIAASEVATAIERAHVLPPVARGDLYRAREAGASLILLIDGAFSHQLAVSPREVIDVIADGALVLGAASMGALRAAECWTVGMRGVGVVYRLYRLGILESDDEVAVATNPDAAHAAVSVALINVRYALSRATRRGLIGSDDAARVLRVALGTFYAERRWSSLLRRAEIADQNQKLRQFCESVDIKRDDARRALRQLAKLAAHETSSRQRSTTAPFRVPERYVGHDRCLGLPREELALELCIWLFGSGHYQKYLWALVVSEEEFHDLEPQPATRPGALRERLPAAIARLLTDLPSISLRLWAELDFLDELDAELMRWHAIRTCADAAEKAGFIANDATLTRAREEAAIRHGVRDFSLLEAEVEAGLLFGAIPWVWVERAFRRLALARCYADARPSSVAI
jgi:hypothetical protein